MANATKYFFMSLFFITQYLFSIHYVPVHVNRYTHFCTPESCFGVFIWMGMGDKNDSYINFIIC